MSRGVVLVQNGSLASDGHLTLLSDAVQTALIDGSGGGSVTGTVTMQRYLTSKYGYKYFSSPFTAATVNRVWRRHGPGLIIPALLQI
ncbi:MAG: hypothetical protein MZV63_40900 [Marinilabiliales bacterium]|nr:hypothetical protein [Marinilabiliales bacterium]